METIESGILTNVLKKLGSFISSIFEYAINEYPDKIKNVNIDDNGVVTFEAEYGGGSVVKVTMTPTKDNEKMYDVVIQPISGPAKDSRIAPYRNKVEYKDKKSLINMLTAYGDSFKPAEGLEDTSNDLLSSTIVKFNKITSSTDISIDINQVIMGTDMLAVPTMEAINTVLDNDEFLMSLPDGESYVELTNGEDNIETNILDDYTCGDEADTLAKSILWCISKSYATQLYLHAINTNVVGDNIREIYTLLDGSQYMTSDAIRILFNAYRTLNPPRFIDMTQITDDVCACMQYNVGCNLSVKEAREMILVIVEDYLASLQTVQFNMLGTSYNDMTYVIQRVQDFVSCLNRELYA